MEIRANIRREDWTKVRKQKPNWSDDGKDWDVYQVKISELHYNEDNGRIATWISTYTSDPNNPPLNSLSREDFNNVIEGFIRRSNKEEALKNLKQDIKKKTQLNPGVILTDGTIVSGNRRFTALRSLYKEDCDDKYEYFECFIVDYPESKQAKEFVKLIETKTQFGVVTEEDYNPIDRLVTIYKYLINEETRIWTVKEYAKKIGIKESEAENLYLRASILVDYLNFIGQPNAFHLARINKLDGPIAELPNLYKKLHSSKPEEWDRIKILFYSEMLKSGDRTRSVRDLKNTYLKNPAEFERLLSDLYKRQEKVEEAQKHENKDTDEPSNLVVNAESVIVKLEDSQIQDAANRTKKLEAREKQKKKVSNAKDTLDSVELDMIAYMTEADKAEMKKDLEKIMTRAEKIKARL